MQSLIYEVDLAYQPDGRLAVDASASSVCDIPDKAPRPCGGWKNPAGTDHFTGPASSVGLLCMFVSVFVRILLTK